MLTSPALAAIPGIRHAFFTRQGGHSAGIYASLNCGAGSRDDPARVVANRATAMGWLKLPADALSTVYQVHGQEVIQVEAPIPWDMRPKADALVTARPRLALGILTADCGPVLFADREAHIIGACHAGWRGALGGVTDATVAAMEKLGAKRERIVAVIGPTIGRRSYEVGPEFPGRFIDADPANARFFAPARRSGHSLFDLPGYLQARLEGLGLGRVDDLDQDTLSDPDIFFSYRRGQLAGEPDYGRQLSAIALMPDPDA